MKTKGTKNTNNNTERVTRREAERILDDAWCAQLKELGFLANPAEVNKRLKEMALSPHTIVGRGLTVGMSVGLGGVGKTFARKVKTRGDLEKVLTQIKAAGEKMPTATRKALKEFTRALPRRGGPGRRRKLNAGEAAQVCDQIGMFIRQGDSLKPALQKVSDMAPTLLGKKVGTRTLQKAWDKRSESSSE